MTNITAKETKKAPQRMCIVCRELKDKKLLLRIVRSPEGNYSFDYTGKANGRGAYICNNKECVERCLKKRLLNKAFKTAIEPSVYEELAKKYEE